MSIPQEYLVPFIVTNVVSILLIYMSVKWTMTTKIVFAVIFFLAFVFNLYNVLNNTDSYLEFGKTSLLFFYRDFIFGDFRDNIILYIIIVAVFQLFLSFCLFTESILTEYGIIGGIIFLVLIAPLGIGSAFPSTLLMALALYIVYVKRQKAFRERMQSRF
jgi:hypothetical protein